MKTTLFCLLFFSLQAFGQVDKLVRQSMLSDSLRNYLEPGTANNDVPLWDGSKYVNISKGAFADTIGQNLLRRNSLGMSKRIGIDSVTTFIKQGSGYSSFGVAITASNGDYLYICKGGDSHSGRGDAVMFRSTDRGRSWSDPDTIYVNDLSNNIASFGGGITKTGRIIALFARKDTVTSQRTDVGYIYSDDDGATWSSRITISGSTITPISHFIICNNGDLLQGAYSWDTTGINRDFWTLRSTDNGINWTYKMQYHYTSNISEPSLVSLGGDTVLALVRNDNSGILSPFLQLLSTNDGDTFNFIDTVAFDQTNVASPPDLYTYYNENNKLEVVCTYLNRQQKHFKYVVGLASELIADGISGWNEPIVIDTTFAADAGYSSVFDPEDGLFALGVYYYSTNNYNTDLVLFSPKYASDVMYNNQRLAKLHGGLSMSTYGGYIAQPNRYRTILLGSSSLISFADDYGVGLYLTSGALWDVTQWRTRTDAYYSKQIYLKSANIIFLNSASISTAKDEIITWDTLFTVQNNGDIETKGYILTPDTAYYYIGAANTDGSWRFLINDDGDLVFQARKSGAWQTREIIYKNTYVNYKVME